MNVTFLVARKRPFTSRSTRSQRRASSGQRHQHEGRALAGGESHQREYGIGGVAVDSCRWLVGEHAAGELANARERSPRWRSAADIALAALRVLGQLHRKKMVSARARAWPVLRRRSGIATLSSAVNSGSRWNW